MTNKPMLVLGMMSGTSVDGISNPCLSTQLALRRKEV